MKPNKKPKKIPEFVLYVFIKGKLRSAFKKLPIYNEALARAKREYFVESKKGKLMRRVHFECALCKRCFRQGGKKVEVEDPVTGEIKLKKVKSEIAVDHVEAIINPETGFVDYNDMIRRMFCVDKGVDGLQVLCNYAGERDGRLSCHVIKTKEERTVLAQTNKRLKAEGKSVTTKDR